MTVRGGMATMDVERARTLLALAMKSEAYRSDAQKYAVQLQIQRDSTAWYRGHLAAAVDRADAYRRGMRDWRLKFWGLVGLVAVVLGIRFRIWRLFT